MIIIFTYIIDGYFYVKVFLQIFLKNFFGGT